MCAFDLVKPLQVLALEILILLLENPSDDSVEMAVEFAKEVGVECCKGEGGGGRGKDWGVDWCP